MTECNCSGCLHTTRFDCVTSNCDCPACSCLDSFQGLANAYSTEVAENWMYSEED